MDALLEIANDSVMWVLPAIILLLVANKFVRKKRPSRQEEFPVSDFDRDADS